MVEQDETKKPEAEHESEDRTAFYSLFVVVTVVAVVLYVLGVFG